MGYLIAGAMFAVYCLGTFVLHQYFHKCFATGMRIRGVLISGCFEKALLMTGAARSQKTTGELMNIVTVDVRKIRDVTPYLLMLVSGPFQIILALFLLYQQIGWSVFIGLAVQIILVPMQGKVAMKCRQLQKEVQKVRDRRMKVVNEVFGAMKVIKQYAWETSYGLFYCLFTICIIRLVVWL